MMRLTKNSVLQCLPDLSASSCQCSRCSNYTLNVRHAKDLAFPPLEEHACNHDLSFSQSSEHAMINNNHLSSHQDYYCPCCSILWLPTASANLHNILAHSTAELRAESYPQISQISSNSQCAQWPSNQLHQEARYKTQPHVFKEQVLRNQSTVHNSDAMPAQSRHDDSKDQPTTPLGVRDTPTSSDDRDAMAGGASWDVTQQSGDTTKVFGMRKDSRHESNLGTKWIEEWRVSDMTTLATLVFLEIVFPTHHEEHGSPKYYHMVEQYYHRLLSRQMLTAALKW